MWECRLPTSGEVVAVVRTEAEASLVCHSMRTFTLAEVGHAIEALGDAVLEAKRVFPGAAVTAVRDTKPPIDWDGGGDEMPFCPAAPVVGAAQLGESKMHMNDDFTPEQCFARMDDELRQFIAAVWLCLEEKQFADWIGRKTNEYLLECAPAGGTPDGFWEWLDKAEACRVRGKIHLDDAEYLEERLEFARPYLS